MSSLTRKCSSFWHWMLLLIATLSLTANFVLLRSLKSTDLSLPTRMFLGDQAADNIAVLQHDRPSRFALPANRIAPQDNSRSHDLGGDDVARSRRKRRPFVIGIANFARNIKIKWKDFYSQSRSTFNAGIEKEGNNEEEVPQESYLYGKSKGWDLAALMRSFFTKGFALFAAAYYAYYLFVVGIVTTVAVFVFKVDYSNIDATQIKREVLLSFEAYNTYAVCFWIMVQVMPSWSTDFDVVGIATSYLAGNFFFSVWFYFSHKLWHSNRTLYRIVHEHHHRSEIVCPLTALSNAWTESVWTSVGFAFAPLLGANNIWGWYMAIYSIVAEAIVGHSRIPFSLEHASHHVVVNKNYGFYSGFGLRPKWDMIFGTWTYSSDVPKVRRVYRRESSSYRWDKDSLKINWDDLGEDSNESKETEVVMGV